MNLWQPQPLCDVDCLPQPGETPTVHIGVRAIRLAAAAAVFVAAAVLPRRVWARAMLRALGVRLTARGHLPRQRALIVANHVSWLDILVLLASTPARIVAKQEVRDWPVIGQIAASSGTIFIDRSRPRALPGTVARAAEAMRGGAVVAVFPEGTTWCGRSSGRFRPAFFQAALDAGVPVVPVTLRFLLKDGTGTTAAAFLGEDTLWESLLRIVAIRGLTIGMTAWPALHPSAGADRRVLARVAESAVRVVWPPARVRSAHPVRTSTVAAAA